MSAINTQTPPDAKWPGLMDAKKAISLLAISRAHFYALVREQKFPQPALRQGPRFTRWKAADVQTWLADPAGWIAANGKTEQEAGAAQ